MRIYNDTVPANRGRIDKYSVPTKSKMQTNFILFLYAPSRDSSSCLTNQVFWSYQKVEA